MYLDNAATTPLLPEVKDYLISILDDFGNPSSLYKLGANANQILDRARQDVAEFVGCPTDNIIFTSGGSASNTLAIRGYIAKHPSCEVAYLPICHKSILKCVKDLNAYPLKVDNKGFVDLDDLAEWLTDKDNPFVIVEQANSELGTIQPIQDIAELTHMYGGRLYLDCTGSTSTLPPDSYNMDMLGFSGHKIGALKGIGVLFKQEEIELEPLVYGAQEQGLFGGTENMLGIASIGRAIECYDYNVTTHQRDYLWDKLQSEIGGCYLVGADLEHRLAHNLYVCFEDLEAEVIVSLLDDYDIQVSTGSACNTHSLTASQALTAIGFKEDDLYSCVRFTLSGKETDAELDKVVEVLKINIQMLRAM